MKTELNSVLDEIEEFLDNRSDVQDGDDGRPRPNLAMQLLTQLRDSRSSAPWDSAGYETFQKLCDEKLEEGFSDCSGPYDECIPQIFASDTTGATQFDSGTLAELIGTGSVAVSVSGRRFVISLQAVEVNEEGVPV